MQMTYECAVYDEDCNRITRDVIAACAPLAEIPDQRIRTATLLAVILTAMQHLDGNSMPDETDKIKVSGIADLAAKIIDSRRSK